VVRTPPSDLIRRALLIAALAGGVVSPGAAQDGKRIGPAYGDGRVWVRPLPMTPRELALTRSDQGMLLGSAVLSGVIDNIPYVATMSPLVYDLVGPGPGLPPEQQSLWWALALGADLGGNATAIGASANVVIIGIAKRNGHPISFWTFTRYGLVVTAVTIALCVPYIALRYFAFA